jgi:cell division septation protein DedD
MRYSKTQGVCMIRKLLYALLLLGAASLQPFMPSLLAAPSSQEQAIITSPRDGAVVRGVVSIIGTAMHPEFWKYEVYYAPEPNPTDQWVFIGTLHETSVEDGLLETWNTNFIPDGVYALRLRVVRRDANYTEYTVHNISVANTKPTETPTLAATPTPQDTPTPPPPTATPEIQQPPTSTPRPSPTRVPATATPQDENPASSRPNVQINTGSLGTAFCYGGGGMIALFVLFAIYAVMRRIVIWLWSLIWDRSRRQDYEI